MRNLVSNARRAATYIMAQNKRSVAEETSAALLTALASRVEELEGAMEPILDEASLWSDASPDHGVHAVGDVDHLASPSRLTIGDMRHMRIVYFGSPEQELEARVESFIEMNGEPEDGELDDLIHDMCEADASRINNAGPAEQAKALGYDFDGIFGPSANMDEDVLDFMSSVASECNNHGAESQLRILFESGVGEAEVIRHLTPAPADSPAP